MINSFFKIFTNLYVLEREELYYEDLVQKISFLMNTSETV